MKTYLYLVAFFLLLGSWPVTVEESRAVGSATGSAVVVSSIPVG